MTTNTDLARAHGAKVGALNVKFTSTAQLDAYTQAAASEWRELFWAVARALNCLPSTFPDANQHVFKAAEKLAAIQQAAGAAPRPSAPTGQINPDSVAQGKEAGV